MTRVRNCSGVVTAVLAVALSSCGGAGGGSRARIGLPTTTHATVRASASTVASTGGGPTASVRGGQQPGATTPPPRDAAPNGVESFGHAAVGAERVDISNALRAYTLALSRDEGFAACKRLAAPLAAQLSSVTHAPDGSCTQTLTMMYARQAPETRRSLRAPAIDAVRLQGSLAIATVDLAPSPGKAFYPLRREGGTWRIAAIGPTPISGG